MTAPRTFVSVLLTDEDLRDAAAYQQGSTDELHLGGIRLSVPYNLAKPGDLARTLRRLADCLPDQGRHIVGYRCPTDVLFGEPVTVLRAERCPWFYRCDDRPVFSDEVDDPTVIDLRPRAL